MTDIDSAMSNLNDTWSKISTEIYSKTDEPVAESNDDNTETVEFEEVK